MNHIKYRKTPHLDDIIRHVASVTQSVKIGDDWVKDTSIKLPTIDGVATVKLHGTNLGVCHDGTNMWFQSRNKIITPLSDNAGSANFCEQHKSELEELFSLIRSRNELREDSLICIYGEFVGTGIFNVGVSQLDKSWFIFSVECDGRQLNECWINVTEKNIYNLLNMPKYDLTLDFSKPQEIVDQLGGIVAEIDKQCPVAAIFGKTGVGEGVVVSFPFGGENVIFKVKGESHTTSKPKVVRVKATKDQDLISNILDVVLPLWRLDQMFELTVDALNGGVADRSMIGSFIKNVASDIIDECQGVFADNGINYQYVGGEVANRARIYFLNRLTSAF